ncbi:MAG TPA: outer membrane lipoprotein carrier protein LolA [Terracidiphilus sp.]|nr:outer membrane lipoprotein carrier protein LolA [Terracidiphilus sp.]
MNRGTLLRRAALLIAIAAPGVASISVAQAPFSAKALAQQIDSHYNSLHSLQAGFVESYQGMGISRTESGTLFLLKPGRMKWLYTSPPGKVFLIDGKYAWLYAPGDSHVQRIPARSFDDLRSPLRYLLGHAELDRELNHLVASPAPNGQFTLTGIPKGMESRVSRLAITVTREGVITSIEIKETDGAITRLTFSHEQPDVPISAHAFRFMVPPGIPIVDAPPPA